MEAENVVAINEQKVRELEEQVKRLEREKLVLIVEKSEAEMLSIQNTTLYFQERFPNILREMNVARARIAELDKK